MVDIVDTAVCDGNFKTLVAAVQAAGLVGTLKSPGYRCSGRFGYNNAHHRNSKRHSLCFGDYLGFSQYRSKP